MKLQTTSIVSDGGSGHWQFQRLIAIDPNGMETRVRKHKPDTGMRSQLKEEPGPWGLRGEEQGHNNCLDHRRAGITLSPMSCHGRT